MPISVTQSKTASGKPYMRMMSSGEVSASDAEGLMKSIGPGAKDEGLPILGLVAEGAKFSPEARQAFGKLGGESGVKRMPVAVVVNSAPLRVMLSFIIRISGSAEQTRFFPTEAQALTWLEEATSS